MSRWDDVVKPFLAKDGDFQSCLNRQAHERCGPLTALPAAWLGGLRPSMEDLVGQASAGMFGESRRSATGPSTLTGNR